MSADWQCPVCLYHLDKGVCKRCERHGPPDTIQTPLGAFYVRATKPEHAELWRPGHAPVTVNNTEYVIRGEFRAEPNHWYWDRRPYNQGGPQKVTIDKPYASGDSYAIRKGGKYDPPTDSARHKIGEAIGPALLEYVGRPEVRADAIDAVRAAAARKWSDRADELRRRVEEATAMIAELDAGAYRVRAGGPLDEPPSRLTYRSSW